MADLPTPHGSSGIWGSQLNAWLQVAHNADGTSLGVINVMEYGATGDGTTDDTAAIQAAVNAAGNNKAVFFPAGVYIISSAITLKPGGAYFGTGPASTIKQKSGANSVYLLTWPSDGVTKKYCRMRDLAIDGNRANNTGVTTYGLFGHMVQYSEFHNVRVQEVNGDAFRFDGTVDGNFDHTTSTVYFSDCWAYGCANNCMVLGSGAGDCHIIGGNYGFAGSTIVTLQAGSCNITGATLWGCTGGPGLSLVGTDNQIRSCNIEGNNHEGILVAQYADHSLIEGCKIYANSTAGDLSYDAIRADGASGDNLVGISIIGNRIYPDMYSSVRHKSAISLGTYHTNAVVIGNVVGFGNANAAWAVDIANIINGTTAGDVVMLNAGMSTLSLTNLAVSGTSALTGTVTIGADTNLYRSGADILKTDDTLGVATDLYSRYGDATNQLKIGAVGGKAGIIFGTAADVSLYRDSAGILRTAAEVRMDGVLRASFSGGSAATDLGAVGPSSQAGVVFGADTNLYRSAADTLKTDDILHLGNGLLKLLGTGPTIVADAFTTSERTNVFMYFVVSGEANRQFQLRLNGEHKWGPGGATALDCTLSRSTTATMKFDSALHINGNIGFNNTSPIAKPTVTGSRGGNAAVASLLTALANYGLITDSSSA